MPRSMITKLIHPDESKRVLNPRVDTLLKIVEFFKTDGFNITVDDLLGVKSSSILIQDQKINPKNTQRTISLFSFDNKTKTKLGTIDIKTSIQSDNVIALLADDDIKPLFKKGSIFIVDPDATLENDTLVAVKLNQSKKIQIKKYQIQGHKRILISLESHEKPIVLMPTERHDILGAVIQINAKT
ncbi:MAG: hypothetical protein EPO11_07485 [Gammaproteobacteria bacterium]|nr:MAG: hypothetical protein EPO11_07485 [Gammaproteobacteria bacterium]